MLSALLTIGKVIGIFLLILFLLLLFLLCLVLLVPVRYTGRAEKQDKIKAFCRASWLCRIISFYLSYNDGKVATQLKIFGIPWKRKEKPSSDAAKEPEEKEEKNSGLLEDAERMPDTPPESMAEERAEPSDAAEKIPDSGEEPDKSRKSKRRKITVLERILDKIRKIRYTIASIYGKILQIKENISKYLAIWHDPNTQKAFAKCKRELVKTLRHLRPGKLKAEITFGTDDPALTGEILGVFSIFYAYIGKNVLIYPDFEKVIFEGNLSVKGRIRSGTLLIIAGRLYFDKNIRKFIDEFRKERADGQ